MLGLFVENVENKIICECGNKTVAEAMRIFAATDLPYKKAKKLVTGCNQTCCMAPLMNLYKMVKGETPLDFDRIAFLLEQREKFLHMP
ncbi:MAG: hypothetical protein LBQ18_08765 [Campylobacteraceae bacterium]|jgi:hypothetical protein|nr:hypothetical protein [Campylobacteraceae bacterium]